MGCEDECWIPDPVFTVGRLLAGKTEGVRVTYDGQPQGLPLRRKDGVLRGGGGLWGRPTQDSRPRLHEGSLFAGKTEGVGRFRE